jgi:hypothetical protein
LAKDRLMPSSARDAASRKPTSDDSVSKDLENISFLRPAGDSDQRGQQQLRTVPPAINVDQLATKFGRSALPTTARRCAMQAGLAKPARLNQRIARLEGLNGERTHQ